MKQYEDCRCDEAGKVWEAAAYRRSALSESDAVLPDGGKAAGCDKAKKDIRNDKGGPDGKA